MWNFFYRIFKVFASMELAVFIILCLATVLATGTIYESKYGAAIASKEVYHSLWMQGILWLLIINLTASAVSRLPWKKQHIGFLVTHLGIIILLLGSFITQRRGVDGSITLAPGSSSRFVRVDENMLNVFRATPGQNYELLLSERLDLDPLHALKKPVVWDLQDLQGKNLPFAVTKYYPKAARSIKADRDSTGKGVPALHFTLKGSRATVDDWLFLAGSTGVTRELGPATLRFTKDKPTLVPDHPTLFLYLDKKQQPNLAVVARGDKKIRFMGVLKPNQSIPLGWMDFSFVLDEFVASAVPSVDYTPLPDTAPKSESFEVIQLALGGERVWLELGASAQVTIDNALYYIQYAKKEVNIGFDLTLQKFQIGYYEGTQRPMSYSSVVTMAGGAPVEISMNHPLKQNGFTFYQASYESDEDGQPHMSVLSVNQDPGRWIKYFGSLMIVLGIISMFYFKPKYSGKNKWLAKETPGVQV